MCHACGHIKCACKKARGHKPRKNSVRKKRDRQSHPWKPKDMSGLHHVSVHKASSKSSVLSNCKVRVSMELDTGASMSLISDSWPGKDLSKTKIKLCTYSKEPVPVLARVQGIRSGPSLFGRNWLEYIHLEIHSVVRNSVQEVDHHQRVFQHGLGKM